MELLYDKDYWVYAMEDLKAIIVEQGWNSRLAFIKMKWLIGERICADENLIKHKKEISEELNIPVSEINRCIRFYKWTQETLKTIDWDEVEDKLEKNISWHSLVNTILPEPKEPEELDIEILLKKRRERERIKKAFLPILEIQKANQFKTAEELLNFLIQAFNIDINKKY